MNRFVLVGEVGQLSELNNLLKEILFRDRDNLYRPPSLYSTLYLDLFLFRLRASIYLLRDRSPLWELEEMIDSIGILSVISFFI